MVVFEKLPPLIREGFMYNSPAPFRLNEDKERKGAVRKDCQQDMFVYNNRHNPVQSRHNSARQNIHYEEKRNYSLVRSEMETVLPLKPGSHRLAFNPSNFQADREYCIQKDSLDCLKEHSESSKQVSNRRQEKYDRSKLGHFVTDSYDIPRKRGETNMKSLSGHQISHKDRVYENEMRLTKEIHQKEILLKEKLLKAAENIRKVQMRTVFEDKAKEEQRNPRKAENSLYYTEEGKWDWESTRDRALGGKRYDGPQEGFNIWDKEKDGIRQEDHVKETNTRLIEKRRKGIERENRNTQRTTKAMEKEWDHFEEITGHTQERARTERDKTRRERVVEQRKNEIREWNQIDRQEKEIVRWYDREDRRHERVKNKKDVDIGDEDQQWDVMDKFALNLPKKAKAVSSYNKKNVLIKDHLATHERVYQYRNMAAEEKPLKQPLPEAGPSTQNGKNIQQEQLSQESNPDADLQLARCEVCNRKFKEDRLEKHISICQKIQKPKRQVYNSSQYRAKGTALEEFMKTKGLYKAPEHKKSNRLQKHKDFVENIHLAHAPAAGGFQPRAHPNPHYITCPHCGRCFAPETAERHIPKCQQIKSRPPPPRQRHQM
ncbi:hypothetical protein Q7C36_011811 [Tachysurus vachellii]|uniref:C2HC/C3H-type domain-containing protein n=1 Tax=Tachysurus vachellii TaxID=175792 RepID=A0AA88MR57_TACVA|nr:hypothetical protein Q7C36_011811 [Tachysurus vachellii]